LEIIDLFFGTPLRNKKRPINDNKITPILVAPLTVKNNSIESEMIDPTINSKSLFLLIIHMLIF
jgi:hypothetical protein